MAFDWKMFAASFLDQVSEGIEDKREKAEEYKEQQEAAAERNAALVNRRKMNAQSAAQIGKRAMQLGASEAQIRTAMSSGIEGINELYNKLNAAATQRGVKKLGVDDIEAIVNMPSIPNVRQDLMDMPLEEFARQTFGARGLPRKPTEDKERNLLGSLFGVDAKDRVKQQLRETEYMDGMSVADINEIARQTDYQSLIPSATMTFLDVPFFDAEKALDFSEKLVETMSDAVTNNEAKIKAAVADAVEAGDDPVAARSEATRTAQELAAETFIEAYAQTYQHGGFFDNEIAIKQIRETLGDDYLRDLMESYNLELPEYLERPTVDEAADKVKNIIEEATEEEKTDTKTKEGEVSTKARIEANVYYINDDGEVVRGVPPRPSLELFGNILGGAGLGGETIEQILKGEIGVPDNLRPGQWDEIFGDFYKPDGTPK